MPSWNCAGLILWGRQQLSFHYRNSKVRQRRFVMGRGSVTLNRVLMDDKLQRNKWREHDPFEGSPGYGSGDRAYEDLVLDQSCEESSYL